MLDQVEEHQGMTREVMTNQLPAGSGGEILYWRDQ